MLELSKISFAVETSELIDAVNKVQALGKAVEGLSASVGKMDQKTAKANETQAKANLLNAKADAVTAKQIENLNKAELAEVKLNQAKVKNTEATEASINATKSNVSILQRQQDILEFQAQGFSKGQSSILASAKAAGVLTGEMKELQTVLEDQRKLMAAQPFDKSQGALKSLRNEYQLLQDVQSQYNNESALTRKQMQELAQDRVRLTLAMKQAGIAEVDQIVKLNALEKEYTQVATSINKMIASENAIDKSTKDAASANAYLEKELQKVRFALDANNTELNRSTSNSLVKFENALKASGMTLDQQKLKLDEYRNAQIALQKTQNSKNTDYITRAVGPQITDIAVGLATGQAPLTIMLQQGGQLRDQFALAGVAAKDMGVVMRTAMSSMASSVYDTGKAIVTMIAGGFIDAGKAVVNFGADITGMNTVLDMSKRYFASLGTDGFKMIGVMDRLGGVISGVFAGAIAGSILVLITLGVELAKMVKQENALSSQLLLTGASLGMNKDQTVAYAESMRELGLTINEARLALTEFAKQGIIGNDNTAAMAKAAIDLEKYTGQSVEDTLKHYRKLQDDPVKALRELSTETGLFSTASLNVIDSLIKQGDSTKALEVAQQALILGTKQLASEARDNLAPISVLWIDIKDSIKSVIDKIAELGTSEAVVNKLTTTWEGFKSFFKSLAEVVAFVWMNIQNLVSGLKTVGSIGVSMAKMDFKGAFDAGKNFGSDVSKNWEDLKKYSDSLRDNNEEKKKSIQIDAKAKQANSEANKAALEFSQIQTQFDSDAQKKVKERNATLAVTTKMLIGAAGNEAEINRILEARDKTLSNINERYKPKKEPKVPKSDAEKEQDRLDKSYEAVRKQVINLGVEVNGVADESTKAEKELQKLMLSADWGKYSDAQRKYIEGELAISSAKERQNAEAKKQQKLLEDIGAIQKSNLEFLTKSSSDDLKLNKSYELRLELLGKTEDQQRAIKEQAELENKLTENTIKFDEKRLKVREDFRKLQEGKDGLSYSDQVKLNQKEAEEIAKIDAAQAKSRQVLNKETSVLAAENYYAEMQKIGKPVSAAITTALFEGGQAGAKSLRDSIVAAFRNKISVWIEANVMGMLMGNGGGAGGVAGAIGGGSGGILGSLSNGVSMASGLGNLANGFAMSSLGQTLGLSTASSLAVPSAAMGYAAESVLAAPLATQAGTLTGMGSTVTGAASGLGSALATAAPYLAAAMLLKSLTDYKVEAKGNGITATLGSNGVPNGQVGTYNEFSQTSSGILSGGNTTNRDWGVADKAVASYIGATTSAATTAVKGYAAALGLAPDLVNGFTKDIEVSLTGLNPQQQKEAIDKAIGGFVDEMVKSAFGTSLESMKKESETSGQTLSRLASSLASVNAMFTELGHSLYSNNLAGAALASSLADSFGGLDKMKTSLSAYYQAFYSETERAQLSTQSLAASITALQDPITGLNISVPTSKDAFRALVSSIDVSTSAGQNFYAALINLAPAFDQAASAANAAASNMMSAVSNWGSSEDLRSLQGQQLQQTLANGGLNLSIQDIMGATQETALAYYNSLSAGKAKDALFNNQQKIFDFVKGTTAQQRQQSGSSGGGGGGGGGGGSSGSSPEKQALDAWQKATDSIVSAMKDLRLTLLEQGPDSFSRLQAQFSIDAAKAQAGDIMAYEELQTLIKPLVEAQKSVSGSSIEESLFVANLFNTLDNLTKNIAGERNLSLPSFAVGTNYVQSDMIAQIHEGEAIVPKAFNPAANGSSTVMAVQLNELNSRVDQLILISERNAGSNAKTATAIGNAVTGVQPLITQPA